MKIKTAKAFLSAYPDSKPNENCLHNMGCPHCGNRSSFAIEATSTFVFSDDGAEESTSVDYDKHSNCQCLGCDRIGVVGDFHIPGLDELIETNNTTTT